MKFKFIFLFLSLCIKKNYSLIPPSQFIHQHPIIATNTINFFTSKLPMLDTFGHKNLEFNEKVIPSILNNNNLPTPIKIELVTDLIKFSQFGDNFGSWIIEHYLQIITYLVHCL
tara:strand:- start:553 stop:894 length:342 start_codon:yes stop_codon:yes gene_type:complete